MANTTTQKVSFDFQGTVRRAGGDESLLVPVLEMVERNISRLTDSIHEAIESSSCKDLEFAAHKLKSQCMTIGAEPASTLCAELEQYGKSGASEPSAKLWERTKPVLEKTRQALLTELVAKKNEL